jgi:hypothetical protein
MAIDTKKAPRRDLRFNSIDDALAEIDRIVAADKAGTLRNTGNWSAGQVFNHIATWLNFSWDGFPASVRPPWIISKILQMMRTRYIYKPTHAGVKIPGLGKVGGTLGFEPMSTEEGARKLKAALTRLKNGEPAKHHSPAFGPMTQEERIQFQLRHCELHMGFLQY